MVLSDNVQFLKLNIDVIGSWPGKICLFIGELKRNTPELIKIDKLIHGALTRCINSSEFKNLEYTESLLVSYPVGICATSIQIIKLPDGKRSDLIRETGASAADKVKSGQTLFLALSECNMCEILYGFFLKSYSFDTYKSRNFLPNQAVSVMSKGPSALKKKFMSFEALLAGIYFTRDLINEPANILNTVEFSTRLEELSLLGLDVKTLDEGELQKLGMNALLAVGQGSSSPSKVVVIEWKNENSNHKPLVLVGKGVVFDSGGISIKPAGGMEEMVMDMGGAGVVAGVMKTIALRMSKSNVIGVIGLVENMPDGNSQRPGDIVKSMKGDTIEVINTDAEGRLVLCDLLWYAQKQFRPSAIIDLATLTGAVIVALGHENAGVFSNDDKICEQFLKSAELSGEGAWRMPLSENYSKLLKSRVADIANTGGRGAGACTAAKFLERFISRKIPWVHIDIAGVAFSRLSSKFHNKGATGWGVSSLNRMIIDFYEKNK